MTENPTSTTPPIVCDMTDAPDTAAERIQEYERLFAQSLFDRERLPNGVRFRFRADTGVEDWVRDLAGREKACCAWLDFAITVDAGEVRWDWLAPDEEIAQMFLEDLYGLRDTISDGPAAVLERMTYDGEQVKVRDNGALRPATRAELGLA
jgi:hypothetical protein